MSDVLEKMITNNKNANSIKEQVDFKIIERLIGNAVNPNDTISKYSAPVLLLYLNAVETILSP